MLPQQVFEKQSGFGPTVNAKVSCKYTSIKLKLATMRACRQNISELKVICAVPPEQFLQFLLIHIKNENRTRPAALAPLCHLFTVCVG